MASIGIGVRVATSKDPRETGVVSRVTSQGVWVVMDEPTPLVRGGNELCFREDELAVA